MKFTKPKTILVLLCMLLYLNSYAQELETDSVQVGLKKNIIYVTLGFAGVYGAANGNYERIIIQKKNGFFKYYLIRFSGGYIASAYGGPNGPHGLAGFSGLTGKKRSHLEVSLGLFSMFYKEEYKSAVSEAEYFNTPEPSKFDYLRTWPAAAIGYRYQKPGDYFVFRVGAALPESFYLSIGFCF